MLSIIIPTYNRKESLFRCMESLFDQSITKSAYEVIVVDDGSTDETEKTVRSLIAGSDLSIRYFKHQTNKGPAAARNLGIKMSQGEVILFMGDDTIATPDLLERHMEWHREKREKEVAVLGYTTWAEDIKITAFMEYLETGPQFGYASIHDPNDVHYSHFYTANISLKKDFLAAHGSFDEDFKLAMWEDIELGYRLSKYGLKLVYNKNALVYHHHPTDTATFLKRQYNAGRYAMVFLSKHHRLRKLLLPTLLNPLLIVPDDQVNKLIQYLKEIEEHISINNISQAGKKSLYFLYDLLTLESYAKGFFYEFTSSELVPSNNFFDELDMNMEGLTMLPSTPPRMLYFLINEYKAQIDHKIQQEIDDKERQLNALLNSWSWRLTTPLRWIGGHIWRRNV